MSRIHQAGRAQALHDNLRIALEETLEAHSMTCAEVMCAVACFAAETVVTATAKPADFAQGLSAFKAGLDDEAARLLAELRA